MTKRIRMLFTALVVAVCSSCTNGISFFMPRGEQGPDGLVGMSAFEAWKEHFGKDPNTPLEEFLKELGQAGTPTVEIVDGYFVINGNNTGIKATGVDGLTPVVTIGANGNWWVDGIDTGRTATGQDGATPTITIDDSGYWVINGVKTNTPAQGRDGIAPEITIGTNGNWFINQIDTGISALGTDGKDGVDGTVPNVVVGANGNWFIDGVDSGVRANGKDCNCVSIGIGSNGNWVINGIDTGTPANGKDGKNGVDGKPASIFYVGENGNWYIDNVDTGVPSKGKDGEDGKMPEITINPATGNWMIGGTDTGHPAFSKDGVGGKVPVFGIGTNGNWYVDGKDTGVPSKGQDGKDGTFPIIGISDNKTWVINGIDTGVPAIGRNGKDGKDGRDGRAPVIEIKDNFWYINDINTKIKVVGANGVNGVADVVTIDPDTKNWLINGKDTGVPAIGKDGKTAYELWKDAVGSGSMTNKDGSKYTGGDTWQNFVDWLDGGDVSMLHKYWITLPGNAGKTIQTFIEELFSCHCLFPEVQLTYETCKTTGGDQLMFTDPDTGVVLVPAGATVKIINKTTKFTVFGPYTFAMTAGKTVYAYKSFDFSMSPTPQTFLMEYTLADGTKSTQEFTVPAQAPFYGQEVVRINYMPYNYYDGTPAYFSFDMPVEKWNTLDKVYLDGNELTLPPVPAEYDTTNDAGNGWTIRKYQLYGDYDPMTDSYPMVDHVEFKHPDYRIDVPFYSFVVHMTGKNGECETRLREFGGPN